MPDTCAQRLQPSWVSPARHRRVDALHDVVHRSAPQRHISDVCGDPDLQLAIRDAGPRQYHLRKP